MEQSSDSGIGGPSYTFSYSVEAVAQSIADESIADETTSSIKERMPTPPDLTSLGTSSESIPIAAFRHASTMQAACRYLVDKRGLSFTAAARLLGRNPKSVWASYQQAKPFADDQAFDGNGLNIPVEIFRGIKPPLEAIVCYLREQGMRNNQVARILGLDPRTTSTAARRGGVRR